MARADDKLRHVQNILRSETYQQDSGFYQRLETALNKLSTEVLADLDTLIQLKVQEAERRVWQQAGSDQ